MMKDIFNSYSNLIYLIIGIFCGSLLGLFAPSTIPFIKPLGDIFLNLLFVSIIPLLFFAIASSVANLTKDSAMGKTILLMSIVFIVTIVLVSLLTIFGLYLFPIPSITVDQSVSEIKQALLNDNSNWGEKIVSFLTVAEFKDLLSREHMLAFVIFSFLIGIAAQRTNSKSVAVFKEFLNGGNEVMQSFLIILMKAAPIGLGAYFGYQVYDIGPQLFDVYAYPLGFYYLFGIVFFFIGFTFYTFMAYGSTGTKRFWKHNIVPSITALSTCSSLATLPANLKAAQNIGIPSNIATIVIPLGNTLYKNGSAISSIVKIYVAFEICGWNFYTWETIILALAITLAVSVVAGGIPNGGYVGEMLMISIYGLPDYAIPAVLIIGTLVDPLATVLNATGDTVAAMLTARFSGRKLNSSQMS